MTDLERAGGEPRVAAVMDRFVREMADDFVIGFLFVGKDLPRIARHEAELAVHLLGGENRYGGRPLATLHRAMKVHRGQFRRRLFVLRRVLSDEGLPPDLVERWIAHHAAMEAGIVAPGDCVDGPPGG